LTENLSLQHSVAKFVPCLQSDEQKQKRLDVTQELFNREKKKMKTFWKTLHVTRNGFTSMSITKAQVSQ
jgi:hypothetical protein